jgi:hypothetical protein
VEWGSIVVLRNSNLERHISDSGQTETSYDVPGQVRLAPSCGLMSDTD